LQGAIDDLVLATRSPMQTPDIHFDKGILLVLQNTDEEAEKEFALHFARFPGPRESMNKRIDEAKKLRANQPQK